MISLDELQWVVRHKETGAVNAAFMYPDQAVTYMKEGLSQRQQLVYEAVRVDESKEAIDDDAIPTGRTVAPHGYGHGYAILEMLDKQPKG